VSSHAEELPFPDESFDAAVFAFVLCSVEDPGLALEEARRVLKPNGKLVLLEHVRGEGRIARWQERLTPLHRKLAGNCHLNRDTRATVEAAGFDVSDVGRTTLPGTYALVRPGIQGVATKTSS
jgi:ubiquinone/menaquinone biosynthesis C-methylase UbiE